jgi:hypothetical protein
LLQGACQPQPVKKVRDRRVLKLLRAFLKAGAMEDGLVSAVAEGTPQAGPLSPLLANLMLDVLGKELERRGHWRHTRLRPLGADFLWRIRRRPPQTGPGEDYRGVKELRLLCQQDYYWPVRKLVMIAKAYHNFLRNFVKFL